MTDLRPAADVSADLIGPCEKVYPKWCKPHNAPIGDRTTCLAHVRVTALIEADRKAAMRVAWDEGYYSGRYGNHPNPYEQEANVSELTDAEMAHWMEWDANYWHHAALTKKRIWWCGTHAMKPYPWIGSDEYWRYTLVLGPIVIALWRIPNWHIEEADTRLRMEELDEQEDA